MSAAKANDYENLTTDVGAGISHRQYLIAQDAKVTPLMSKDLAEFPGKEGLMITVVYPPGAEVLGSVPTHLNVILNWSEDLDRSAAASESRSLLYVILRKEDSVCRIIFPGILKGQPCPLL